MTPRPLPVLKLKNPENSLRSQFSQIRDYLLTELLERLEIIKINPQKILLLGENSDLDSNLKNNLNKKYPKAEIFYLSPGLFSGLLNPLKNQASPLQPQSLLQRFAQKISHKNIQTIDKISGDFNDLPLRQNSVDLIISNLDIFNSDLKKSFPELSRVLKKDGLLMLTLPGPDTFLELRRALNLIDLSQNFPPFPVFPDMHDLGDQLIKSKFKDPVLDTERFILNLNNLNIFLENLNFLKITHSPEQIKNCESHYLKNTQGEYPIQFEINFAHAWGTEPQQVIDPEGYARVSLSGLKASLKSAEKPPKPL